jgi:hypothetical protein
MTIARVIGMGMGKEGSIDLPPGIDKDPGLGAFNAIGSYSQ